MQCFKESFDMARLESSTTTTGIGQSSITLLQERFKQLRRAKEMREEKKMSKIMDLKPTNNHTSNRKLHLHPHLFKSSPSSSVVVKSKAMMLGFESARFDSLLNKSSGASQSQSLVFSSSPSSSSLSLRHNSNDSHHHDRERNKTKKLYCRHRHEKKKKSLEYYCDIGKFLQVNNNGSDRAEKVVRQYDIMSNVHHPGDQKMMKRFDHMGGSDDIDTSLHL
ncbi:unnamed protein product [Linum trigynum]|uniref:Uncharacterized protein n=1 Tax=Linum trigynum TaxID=586398 RepID=A0AAV2DBC5_9ROSI